MHKREKKKVENVFEDFQRDPDGVSGCGASAARKLQSFEDGGRKWQQFNGSAGGRVEEMRRSRDWREQELGQEPPPNQHPQNLSRRTAAEPPAAAACTLPETSTRSCARETKTVEESWGTSCLDPPPNPLTPQPPPPTDTHPPKWPKSARARAGP